MGRAGFGAWIQGAEAENAGPTAFPRDLRAGVTRARSWALLNPGARVDPAEPRARILRRFGPDQGTGFGFKGIGGSRSTTLSISPYSRASSGDMKRSRSVSSWSRSRVCPVCFW